MVATPWLFARRAADPRRCLGLRTVATLWLAGVGVNHYGFGLSGLLSAGLISGGDPRAEALGFVLMRLRPSGVLLSVRVSFGALGGLKAAKDRRSPKAFGRACVVGWFFCGHKNTDLWVRLELAG